MDVQTETACTRRAGLRWLTLLPLGAGAVGSLVGCSSKPSARPPPGQPPVEADDPPRTHSEPQATERAQAVTIHAMGLVGTPYRYGGNTPESGFDCSGLIGYVFWHSASVRTPRTVNDLSTWGTPVGREAARSGDLAVFTLKGRTSHAGIYVGNGRFVHAPSSGGTVRLDRLDRGYWATQGVQFRRAV